MQSLLRQALIHMLKAQAWPVCRDAPTWTADAIRFRADAADRFAPSMRQKVDVARLYRRTVRALPAIADGPPCPVPEACPVTLDEWLAG